MFTDLRVVVAFFSDLFATDPLTVWIEIRRAILANWAWASAFIGLLFGLWAPYYFKWYRPRMDELEKLQFTFLPFQERSVRASAVRDRATVTQNFLSGDLRRGELLQAAILGFPVHRKALDDLDTSFARSRVPESVEFYADRGQGLSVFLATAALALSKHRTVLYAAWPGAEASRIPSSWDLMALLQIHSFSTTRLGSWFRRPVVILDACPQRSLATMTDPRFEGLLTALDRQRLPYIIGTRRFRHDPLREEHASWLGRYQELGLASEETAPIARRWLSLAGTEEGWSDDRLCRRGGSGQVA